MPRTNPPRPPLLPFLCRYRRNRFSPGSRPSAARATLEGAQGRKGTARVSMLRANADTISARGVWAEYREVSGDPRKRAAWIKERRRHESAPLGDFLRPSQYSVEEHWDRFVGRTTRGDGTLFRGTKQGPTVGFVVRIHLAKSSPSSPTRVRCALAASSSTWAYRT